MENLIKLNPKLCQPNSAVIESLEIKKAKTKKRRKVLNHNEGYLVKTNTWTPLFDTNFLKTEDPVLNAISKYRNHPSVIGFY